MTQVSKAVEGARKIAVAGLADAELLSYFLDHRDEAAFAALVQRHGPMVWNACRRLLNEHDAEDAFQGVFLVLFRRATSIKPRKMLANWLYGVAHQTSLHVRRTTARRRTRERQVAMPEHAAKAANAQLELRGVLDVELSRLPDRYRAVIVLCDLEGRTQKEAARQLGCPVGTVAGHLARGRAMLARRLRRHGLGVSGGALATVLAKGASAMPTSVFSSTVATVVNQTIPAKVVALAEGVIKAMLLTKLKTALTILLVLGLMASAATLVGRTARGDTPPIAEQRPAEEAGDVANLQGTWKLTETYKHGKKVDPTDIPINPHELIFDGSKVETRIITKGGGDRGKYELNTAATPRQLTITWLVRWRAIYRLEADRLTICFNPENGIRPDEFRTAADSGRVLFVYERVKNQRSVAVEKQNDLTAWGKAVGGLQAGVSIRPDRKVYHHGETITLIIRVRNIGKEVVKFSYLEPFFEHAPTVFDSEGTVPQADDLGELAKARHPREVTLPPGREIELHQLKRRLLPARETDKQADALYGTGKLTVHYQQVFGRTDMVYRAGRLDPDLSNLATGKLHLEVQPPTTASQPDAFTAWGKEVGGLQAGLEIRPGKRVYHHGETVTLFVRVRNVSKEAIMFEYLRQFLDENPPAVTAANGNVVGQARFAMLGEHGPVAAALEPGKEMVLESRLTGASGLKYQLNPDLGTGKVSFQYPRVLGNSSSGFIKLDPALSKLATGKLEIEVKDAEKREKKGVTASGNEDKSQPRATRYDLRCKVLLGVNEIKKFSITLPVNVPGKVRIVEGSVVPDAGNRDRLGIFLRATVIGENPKGVLTELALDDIGLVDGKADVKRLYSNKHLGTVQGFSFDSEMLAGQLTVNVTVQRMGAAKKPPQKQAKEEMLPVGRLLDLDEDSFPDILVNGRLLLDGNLLRGSALKADLDGDTFPDILVNGQFLLDGNLLRGRELKADIDADTDLDAFGGLTTRPASDFASPDLHD